MDFTRILPQECQSLIISLTSPADVCRSTMIFPSLRSVADSDAVWEKFLPCDYNSIVSLSSSLLSMGKKDLYSHPILIQNDIRHIIGFRQRPVGLNVNVDGVASREERRVSYCRTRATSPNMFEREETGGWRPKWVSFFNESDDGGTVEFILKQIDTGYPKRGLIIEGIELRPKVVKQWA
ncbi:F-box family protein [Hibiscus syriacus]|uniref:F-box family protein n=1 Tax=Hibiscus syriacus TaxID=106335 RepID=A0A6A2WSI0_HIBSY|nr:F-box family protein [Hibiscus syriacus]